MTQLHPSAATRRSIAALGVGLAIFAGLSCLRIRIQSATSAPPAVGLTLSLLMYFLSGCAVGLLVPRRPVLSGALLGLLTVAVVCLEVPLQFRALSWIDVATALLAFAGLGVAVCAAGSAAAVHWRKRRGTPPAAPR